MTAAELNTALGEAYTPLQIANAVKLISGGTATRVTRTVRNAKELQVEKEYAAYYLEGLDAGAVPEPRSPGALASLSRTAVLRPARSLPPGKRSRDRRRSSPTC